MDRGWIETLCLLFCSPLVSLETADNECARKSPIYCMYHIIQIEIFRRESICMRSIDKMHGMCVRLPDHTWQNERVGRVNGKKNCYEASNIWSKHSTSQHLFQNILNNKINSIVNNSHNKHTLVPFVLTQHISNCSGSVDQSHFFFVFILDILFHLCACCC